MSALDDLKKMTTVVADTGDIELIAEYHPTDATTNPSLILAAAQKPEYRHLIEEAVSKAKETSPSMKAFRSNILDWLFVIFGREISKLVPGRISTEVDAHLSFDVKGSVAKAHTLIKLYESMGVPRERILIKLASTWEGAKAARQLESEGIHVNMTLMFSLAQAIVCAKAGATLISPFVGRVLDWYKKAEGVQGYAPAEDPGVKLVTSIYHYYKRFGYPTQVMGASFRNTDEILELAGCDLLTISPALLKTLAGSNVSVPRKLDSESAAKKPLKRIALNEHSFRFQLNEDPMATEKLAEGIRNFAADAQKLLDYISKIYN